MPVAARLWRGLSYLPSYMGATMHCCRPGRLLRPDGAHPHPAIVIPFLSALRRSVSGLPGVGSVLISCSPCGSLTAALAVFFCLRGCPGASTCYRLQSLCKLPERAQAIPPGRSALSLASFTPPFGSGCPRAVAAGCSRNMTKASQTHPAPTSCAYICLHRADCGTGRAPWCVHGITLRADQAAA